jgi:carboxyl-terminal processing protease
MDNEKNVAVKHRSNALLACLLVAVVSFAAGMRSDAIFGAVAPLLGMRVSTATLDLSSVQETYQQLSANFDGKLDTQQLINGANRGLVAAAGDAHTVFLDPDDVKELNNDLSGNIGGGIGAEIGLRNDQLTIIRPLDDSPALKAGVQAGDIILSVNDEDVAGWTVDRVVQKIRGEIGTKVKLSLMRGSETKEISVTRQEVKSPTVEATVDGEVGVLTVHMFNSETGSLARAEAEKFLQQGVKKVILDLRGNPGGEVSAAQSLAGLWLDHQVVLTQRRGQEIIQTNKSTGTPILADMKTVVLVNGGSASASEIVAGALRDYDKATLVGETTYGKGSVQAVLQLSGGAQLKVTESRWYTPKGKNIDGTGIAPDVKVELTADDINNNRDPQMDKAKSL